MARGRFGIVVMLVLASTAGSAGAQHRGRADRREPPPYDTGWRGDPRERRDARDEMDRRTRCREQGGGSIIGAIAGGLLGNGPGDGERRQAPAFGSGRDC